MEDSKTKMEDTKKELANMLAEEIANSLYGKIILMKHLPEIEQIEKGEIKALKNEEISDFLKSLKKSN